MYIILKDLVRVVAVDAAAPISIKKGFFASTELLENSFWAPHFHNWKIAPTDLKNIYIFVKGTLIPWFFGRVSALQLVFFRQQVHFQIWDPFKYLFSNFSKKWSIMHHSIETQYYALLPNKFQSPTWNVASTTNIQTNRNYLKYKVFLVDWWKSTMNIFKNGLVDETCSCSVNVCIENCLI